MPHVQTWTYVSALPIVEVIVSVYPKVIVFVYLINSLTNPTRDIVYKIWFLSQFLSTKPAQNRWDSARMMMKISILNYVCWFSWFLKMVWLLMIFTPNFHWVLDFTLPNWVLITWTQTQSLMKFPGPGVSTAGTQPKPDSFPSLIAPYPIHNLLVVLHSMGLVCRALYMQTSCSCVWYLDEWKMSLESVEWQSKPAVWHFVHSKYMCTIDLNNCWIKNIDRISMNMNKL